MLKLHIEIAFIQVCHESCAQICKLIISVILNSADVRPEDLFLDLLDLEAYFLTVRRVQHKALHRLPRLQRERVPLFGLGAESIHKATEDVATIDITLSWLLDERNSIESAYTDRSEDSIDLL